MSIVANPLPTYATDMAFNHYAKMKRILEQEPAGWYIQEINKPTTAQNFKGDIRHFDHYYRIYRADGSAIPYCKFQQLDRLADILKTPAEALPIKR